MAWPLFVTCTTTWKGLAKPTSAGSVTVTARFGGFCTWIWAAGSDCAEMVWLEKLSTADALTLNPTVPAGSAMQAQVNVRSLPASSGATCPTGGLDVVAHAVVAGEATGVTDDRVAVDPPVFVTVAVSVKGSPTEVIVGAAAVAMLREAPGAVATVKPFARVPL
ncbi:MAG TPA: hypothetical protein VMT17_11130 [Anaeromyxobacteraceae bacterium]|nr:hypothetical protein [Anaeromyxobacteraceae bacterium]